jgi:hypothetical protein
MMPPLDETILPFHARVPKGSSAWTTVENAEGASAAAFPALDNGIRTHNRRELPKLARLEAEPTLWISPDDAAIRNVANGAAVRIFNARGDLRARAIDRIPSGTLWMQ